MNLVAILGTSGVVINWLLACLGMPAQIYKNYNGKSVYGLSKITFALMFIVFALSFAYGISINNDPLVYGNILPFIFSAVILGQIMYYSRKGR